MTIKTYAQFRDSQKTSRTSWLRSSVRNAIINGLSFVSRGCEKRFVRCLYCHYVFDDQISLFRDILNEISEMGDFISTAELHSYINGSKTIDGRYFHLSFDDGLRNNYTNASKVLRELDIPALFFVPSSLIDADYEKEKNYCLEITRYPGHMNILKINDLKDMISQGFEIGSHTRTHANLGIQNGERLIDEIIGSKHELENMLGINCKYISWPYGAGKHISETALKVIKEAGYELCFSAIRGTITPLTTDKYFIPRHHFEVNWPMNQIKFFLRGNFEQM